MNKTGLIRTRILSLLLIVVMFFTSMSACESAGIKKRLDLIREKLPGEYNEFIPISAEETEAFYDITTRVTRSVLLPPILQTYLKDNMEPYLKKKAEFEDCYNDLLNVLKLYKDE